MDVSAQMHLVIFFHARLRANVYPYIVENGEKIYKAV